MPTTLTPPMPFTAPTSKAGFTVNSMAAQTLGLTERQVESAQWVAEGKTDEEIGLIIGCSGRTAKHHVLNAMSRTDTHTRAQLITQLFIKGVFEVRNTAAAVVMAFTACLIAGPADSELVRQPRHRRKQETAFVDDNVRPTNFLDYLPALSRTVEFTA